MASFRAAWTSPVGRIEITGDDHAVRTLYFREGSELESDHLLARQAVQELQEYFAGKRQSFSVPVAPQGTAFQLSVWKLLQAIPYGETRHYGQLARELGDENKSRAVGAANGANPISILIPCHRVLGKAGDLTGYAGGMERKQFLLGLESQQKSLF